MKVINIKVDDELHKKMKMEALRQDKSVKKYITDLIEKDVEKEKE